MPFLCIDPDADVLKVAGKLPAIRVNPPVLAQRSLKFWIVFERPRSQVPGPIPLEIGMRLGTDQVH